eukprot:CAMPEP_0119511020 /NCGR_PEP_ID=MMETSP1344-20130328/29808_1 /TAXON_ID=236787 /ORGANISM="Florenciella parvula, Strain CCMP2471" /LENGTH=98 /DNA_ID=CAMNT_0007547981 /DNA_START=247 /DNA_END=539 /DNA_ORIENTATION=-
MTQSLKLEYSAPLTAKTTSPSSRGGFASLAGCGTPGGISFSLVTTTRPPLSRRSTPSPATPFVMCTSIRRPPVPGGGIGAAAAAAGGAGGGVAAAAAG